MEAIRSGVEKVKEVAAGKCAEKHTEKANDPTLPVHERVEHALDAGKAQLKEEKHAAKSDCHAREGKTS
ncbi:unnamed protein product [Didymodactylos carnosus]|uniref:Uncharacterized protein n=1 Tax=Didymodactylos carnosus TaxID=1234261 RepID=A0A816CB29_9BILA|nr:unnamed protein product [Didymodactylos carnosus]CAF1620545.1 unnamed protein product [Didymodactylos carnosus]CAF4406865.1 unnamed protein product [Didymodactylos carnosus]CAF4510398.1 unnamed protein product [Didymodactylos carnosus]